jgi:hypothetical protein
MPSDAVIKARQSGYRYKVRATTAPPIKLTPRDYQILEAVHKYRVLHRAQICDLFFEGVNDEGGSARRRLSLLYQQGYLERIPRFISPPSNNPGPAYRLAQRGAVILAEQRNVPHVTFNYWGKSEDRDSHRTNIGHAHLEHNLMLTDIRMEFERQAKAANCQIETWLDYFDLRASWKTERVTIRLSQDSPEEDLAIAPDGYFVLLTEKGRGHFFLEADRGTETIDRQWKRKIMSYKEYLRSGKFHHHYQATPGAGFRVLTVASSGRRSDNLQLAAERFGTSALASMFLFVGLDEFVDGGLDGRIWRRGGSSEMQSLL